MKKNVFIGGAWPYANNSLHVGHLAALLPGDIIARYHRLQGANVIYVSGTDSHGTPITVRAKKEGVSPKSIADKYHKEFEENFNKLDFSYDVYTSTDTPYHAELVQQFLRSIKQNGYIYQTDELQDFCESCNNFLADREIVGVCALCGGVAKGDQCESCFSALNPKDVLNKKCSLCGGETVLKSNTHLVFALSKFQKQIQGLSKSKAKNWRLNAVNETEKYLKMGLIDRVVTRQLDWGIDVPFEGFEDKKIYVWVEAVLGYLTAGKKAAENKKIDFEKFMSSQNTISYYVHGKDNIPFHTVIFPALVLAINNKFNLPDFIVSSEYVNTNNEKMSKSKGNLVTVNSLVEMFPKDSIRYYMIANGPETKDVNFSFDDFVQNHNKFLVGVFGNFVNRNLSYINKKFDGKIKAGTVDKSIIDLTLKTYKEVGELIEKGKLKLAITTAINYVSAGNKFYDEQKPWLQVFEDINAFNNTTYTCVYMMANMANLLAPFMPETCQKINKKLGLSKANFWGEVKISGDLTVTNNELLFERLKV